MNNKKNKFLVHYAGMATQILAGIGLSTWLGLWIDKKRDTTKPLFTWILPLSLLVLFLVKAIKDTNKK